jgi:hypothetical protein
MTDNHWSSPDFKLPPTRTTPRPTELLWTLHKGARTAECRLLTQGEQLVDLHLFREGEFSASRLFPARAAALQYSNAVRHSLEDDGWREA